MIVMQFCQIPFPFSLEQFLFLSNRMTDQQHFFDKTDAQEGLGRSRAPHEAKD